MIFWILVAIVILLTIWHVMEEGAIGFLMGVVHVCWASLVLILALIPVAFGGLHYQDRTDFEPQNLRAIGSDSDIEGRFYFLGGGYVNEERVLNYIAEKDGYSYLGVAEASRSKIFEDESQSPYVDTYKVDFSNGWFVPWVVFTHTYYEFHIPADSVVEDYTVLNN